MSCHMRSLSDIQKEAYAPMDLCMGKAIRRRFILATSDNVILVEGDGPLCRRMWSRFPMRDREWVLGSVKTTQVRDMTGGVVECWECATVREVQAEAAGDVIRRAA